MFPNFSDKTCSRFQISSTVTDLCLNRCAAFRQSGGSGVLQAWCPSDKLWDSVTPPVIWYGARKTIGFIVICHHNLSNQKAIPFPPSLPPSLPSFLPSFLPHGRCIPKKWMMWHIVTHTSIGYPLVCFARFRNYQSASTSFSMTCMDASSHMWHG